MTARIQLGGVIIGGVIRRPATAPGNRVVLRLTMPRLPYGQFALATATFLQPVALMAFAVALWRIGVDVRMARSFVISEGLFSHWQVWLAVTGVLQVGVLELNRLAKRAGVPSYFGSGSRRGPIEIEISRHAMPADCDSPNV